MKKQTIFLIIIFILIILVGFTFYTLNTNNEQSSDIEKINIDTSKNDAAKSSPLSASDIVCDKTDPKLCNSDDECICVEDAGCFMGNKNYYKKCIDKTGGCFDLCAGWGQKTPKCIDNKCENVY